MYYLAARPQDLYPRVSTVLESAKISDFSFANADIMRRAANFGSAVHMLTELHDEGKDLAKYKISDELLPYFNAYLQFKEDFRFDVKFIEKAFISQRYGYGCRIDRIGETTVKKWRTPSKATTIVDIKTSTALHPAAGVQVAANLIAYNENHKKIDAPRATRRIVVLLTGDGSYMVPENSFYSKNDFSVFYAALVLHQWNGGNAHENKEEK
jgi:hypothetical protein